MTSFDFNPVPWTPSSLSSKKATELLTKWNLLPDLKVVRFSCPQLRAGSEGEAVSAMTSSPSVCQALQCSKAEGEVEVKELSATVLNMNFFDALTVDNEVVTSTDMIRACMDETIDGLTVQDKLREMLANPDSENASVFAEKEKGELIYHLLKVVCLGGSMCQAEDKFHEYKEMVKAMYRDLLSVQKTPDNKVQIVSKAFHVDPWGESDLFKTKGQHNRFYVAADAGSKTLSVVYKPWVNFW